MNTLAATSGRTTDRREVICKRTWQTSRCRLAESGQGLVEYALILVLIAIVAVGVLTELGGQTSEIFSSVNCTLDGGAVASTNSNHPGNPQGGGGGLGNNTTTTSTGGC
jgi:pilus assembly protein Flp/PilA